MKEKLFRPAILVGLLASCLSLSISGGAVAQTRSHYVRQYDAADTVIVFVHGVLGDSVGTWTNDNKAYWPDLLTKDHVFDGTDIYVYQYPTSASATLSIDELSENMRLLLDTSGVSNHRHIVFLVHSMGGLVTRAYILKYRRIADRTAFIYFFSTPTTGSELANLAQVVLKTPQVKNLQIMQPSGYLADLQRQWLAARFLLPSYCGYETRATVLVHVVTQASASNLCNQRLDPIDADHITIVKPVDDSDVSYLAFKSAFQEIIQKTPSEPKSTFDVHPNFKPVYDAFASELGRPRGPAKLSDDAYQAEYDRAHIIWIKPLLTIYYLPDNNEERKVTSQQDTAWAPPELFDDSKLRPRFATPDDKLPPHGGVAYHWLKEPDRWKWIGWRQWYCRFFDEIFYQEFDSGVMLGPFHASPTRDEGQIITILNNGRWVARQAPVNAPDCVQVAEPFPTRTR